MMWEQPHEPCWPVEFSPVPVAVILATWSTPILSASSVARVYVSSANNMVALSVNKRTWKNNNNMILLNSTSQVHHDRAWRVEYYLAADDVNHRFINTNRKLRSWKDGKFEVIYVQTNCSTDGQSESGQGLTSVCLVMGLSLRNSGLSMISHTWLRKRKTYMMNAADLLL